MLGILLLILKIIGFLLLGLICLLLALLLLVLFVPVPYRLQAEFGDAFTYRLRIFGIQVFPKEGKPGKKKRGRKKKKDASGKEAPKDGKEEPVSENRQKEQPSEKPPGEEAVPPQETPASEKSSDGRTPPGQEALGADEAPRKGKEKKAKKEKGAKKGMDAAALRAKWELLRAELTNEGNRRAVCHGFSELAYILRHFGPRKVKADLAYSLADPANTGYATAALSLCPFIYGKDCGIFPDFESEKLYAKGWVDVRGHVRLVHLGLSGLRLLIDRDIRAIIRKIRRSLPSV